MLRSDSRFCCTDAASPTGASAGRWLPALVLAVVVDAHAWRIEAGTFTAPDTFVSPAFSSVNFQQAFDVTPLVFTLPTNQGGDPATLRIHSVTTAGFQIAPVEPNANDGAHLSMNPAHYIAVEPGAYTLPDGRLLEAGSISTTTLQHGNGVTGAEGYVAVNWTNTFATVPAVLAMVQTMNNESSTPPTASSIPWLTTAVQSNSITVNGMNLALERSESGAGAVSVNEQIAYLAIEGGVTGIFLDSAANRIDYESTVLPDNILGWDNGCYSNNYQIAYAAIPIVVATKNRHDGGDGGWLRRCALSNTALGLTVDEDIDNDTERVHTTESAGLIAFSTAFAANLVPDINVVKTSSVCSDPVSATTNPKAIPGAYVDYVVSADNLGNGATDTGGVLVTDPIPAQVQVFVGDLDDCGSPPATVSGPIDFIPGSSGLSYAFVALSSTADSLEFSSQADCANFNYIPDPVGVGDTDADGFNSQVCRIRVVPGGAFLGTRVVGNNPAFSFRFRVRVD